MPKKSAAEKQAAAEERERKRLERAAAKAAEEAAAAGGGDAAAGAEGEGGGAPALPKAAGAKKAAAEKPIDKFGVLQHCTITGVLASRLDSRDVQIDHMSLTLYGKELISDTQLHVSRRAGIVFLAGLGCAVLVWG
jgi:hypothetical protein